MTQLGEGVWSVVPTQSQDKKQHNASVQVVYPNGKPYNTPTPLLASAKVNGASENLAPNLASLGYLPWLEPGSQVEYHIEPDAQLKVDDALANLKKTFAEIIKLEREEQQRLDDLLMEEDGLTASLILTGAFLTGVGKGAKNTVLGLVEVVGAAAELAKDAAWFAAQVTVVNHIEAAWQGQYQQGNLKEYYKVQAQKADEDFAKAFGMSPSKIPTLLRKAYEIYNYIMDHPPSRDMLKQFALDYAGAQAHVEKAEFAGGCAFEIILTAILAFFTGGAGNVAQASAKIRHMGQFKTLAGQLGKLFEALTHLKAKKVLKGTLDNRVKHTITPPLPEKVTVPKGAPKPLGQEKRRAHKPPAEKANPPNSTGKPSQKEAPPKPPQNKAAASSGKPDYPEDRKKPVTNASPGKNPAGVDTPEASCCPQSGCPISMVTGEELLVLTEFSLQAALELPFERMYRSSNRADIGMGVGWQHSFQQSLLLGADTWVLQDGEGRLIEFTAPAPMGYSRNTAENLLLHWASDDCILLWQGQEHQGLTRQFGRPQGQGRCQLTRIFDTRGNALQLDYQGEQLTHIHSSCGGVWQLHYHNARLQEIYYLRGEFRQRLANYDYSPEGDLIAAYDSLGHAERYSYQQHQIQHRQLKSGYNYHFEWQNLDPQARCLRNWGDPIDGQATYDYRFAWDTAARRAAVTDTRGATARYLFDEAGRTLEYQSPEGLITRNQYDADGRLIKRTHPDGHSEHFQYNDQGQLALFANAAGQRYQWHYNRTGQLEEAIDPIGHRWQFRYDDHGQLIQKTNPLGHAIRYQYNERGWINRLTDAAGHDWHYLWNPQGQLTASRNPQGQHTRYSYNPQGQLTHITWPNGQTTHYSYNPQGQCTQVETPGGERSHYNYNALGLVTEVRHSTGLTTRYEYDGLSQVRRRIDPNGQVLQYHYDGERNLIGLTNEKGEHYQLRYDLDERLIEEIGFDGRRQSYHYNPAGYLAASQEWQGEQPQLRVQYQRDPLGRLLQQSAQHRQGSLEYSQYDYDATGRLVLARNPHRTLRYAYDALGQVTDDWQDHQRIRHSYDPRGLRQQTILPGGQTLHYQHDSLGAFQALSLNGEALVNIERDALGREISRRHSNQLISEHSYDPQGRLIAQRLGKLGPQSFNALSQRRYHYNPQGNLAQIDDSRQGTSHYHYDALDRLQRVQGPNPEHFIHDPAGNLLGETTAPNAAASNPVPSNPAPGNRLQFFADAHYHYDTSGNRIGQARGKNHRHITRYAYNALHQLIAVEHNGQQTHYRYDALGRRIAKQNAQKTVEFLWLGDVLLQESHKPTNATAENTAQEKIYLFEPNSFKPLAQIINGETYHYHLDHLGTPLEITNAQGKIAWSARFKAYGNLAVAYANDIENPLRFQGQYFDEETGLHYNRFRYYDPNCGRFINQDPIGLLGGVNNYLYVPNPMGWVDPLGLVCKEYNPREDSPLDKNLKLQGQKLELDNRQNYVHPIEVLDGKYIQTKNFGLGVPNTPLMNDVITFRGDARPPNIIFNEGFTPRGTGHNVKDYVNNNVPSKWVGTSKSPDSAMRFATKGASDNLINHQRDVGFLYTVRVRQGYDINTGLGHNQVFSHEHEVIANGGINLSDVLGVQPVNSFGKPIGPFIPNPNSK
jgi:RHS repeat-associated protein